MKKRSRNGMKRIMSILVLLCVILSQGLAIFAEDSIVANDPNYNPISSDLKALSWDVHDNHKGFDNAFTQAISSQHGNGSTDHIVIGESSVTFFGYGVPAYLDYIYYDAPAPEDPTKVDDVFEFSIQPEVLGTQGLFHSLQSFGFMINCTQAADGTISGYFLALQNNVINVYMLSGVDMAALAAATHTTGGTSLASVAKNVFSKSFAFTAGVETRFVLKSNYSQFSVEVDGTQLMALDIATANVNSVPQGYSGGNDFGFYAAYNSHNCAQLSYAYIKNIKLKSASVASKTGFDINVVDSTNPAVPMQEPEYLATYKAEGYIGQNYTITPVQKIGKLVYIGDDDVITGTYGSESTAPLNLPYANPTINVQSIDEKGAVISTDKIDGLNLNQVYEVEAKTIAGYQVKGIAKQSVTLTKKQPTTTIGFKYDKLEMSAGVPYTNDYNNNTWIIAASVAALAMVLGFIWRGKKVCKED